MVILSKDVNSRTAILERAPKSVRYLQGLHATELGPSSGSPANDFVAAEVRIAVRCTLRSSHGLNNIDLAKSCWRRHRQISSVSQLEGVFRF